MYRPQDMYLPPPPPPLYQISIFKRGRQSIRVDLSTLDIDTTKHQRKGQGKRMGYRLQTTTCLATKGKQCLPSMGVKMINTLCVE